MSAGTLADPVAATKKPAPQLVRGLGGLDATMIVVGILIGSGIFIVSSESARLVGSPGWLLAAWLLAGVMTITGALCCSELAAMMPRAGGQYVFLREAYGPTTGFMFGWALFLVIQTGKIAAVAVAFASFTGVLFPAVSGSNYLVPPIVLPGGEYALSLSTQQLVAIVSILLLTGLNTRGLQAGKLVQNGLTFIKIAALAGLIFLGLTLGRSAGAAAFTSSWWNPWANGWDPAKAQEGLQITGVAALAMLLGKAMVGPLFSQSGWNNVTFTGGEVSQPGRNLPRALLGGCAIVVGLYLLANLAYVLTLPLAEIQNAPEKRVAVSMMKAIFGPGGMQIMAAAIMVSTFGCNHGLILAGARVFFAMARDGLFFNGLAGVNRQHVPAAALLAQGLWTCLLTIPRTVTVDPSGAVKYGNVYTQLLEYLIPVDLVFYGLMVASVIVMRRRAPDIERPFRTWGYPVVPLLYLGIAALLVLDLTFLNPKTSGIGFLLVLTGIPVYLFWRRRAHLESAFEGAVLKSRPG